MEILLEDPLIPKKKKVEIIGIIGILESVSFLLYLTSVSLKDVVNNGYKSLYSNSIRTILSADGKVVIHHE